ncbi:DUF1553 domain-containing protein [Roseiconus sp. JC912]|uniref:DUF1553 domain-containing protein n=2 Tax=Pirellulaceae TaxID=2691357 RepID=UPI003A4C724C
MAFAVDSIAMTDLSIRRLADSTLLRSFVVVVLTIGFADPALAEDSAVDFAKDVAPILREHCLRCHRPGNAKGDLSIESEVQLIESDFVIPNDSQSSYLIELITAVDGEKPAMPAEGEPLSDQQVGTIRRWIDEGAKWPEGFRLRHQAKADANWWAFKPLQWNDADTIDTLIDEQLAKSDLSQNQPASRRVLIRRATYDLIGLPPTPAEIDAFVNDESPDAYEKLIDRLLQSHHYGERWGRHWLDVVRFGESNGFERNVIINDLWPFRDYVIASLNEDKPFDQLIREHIAGDVIAPNDPRVVIGSAFLVAGPYDDVGNQDPVQAAQIRANTIDEMIRSSSEAFMGLTMGCARCHDHKFDPITQEDYYSLYSTFAGTVHGSEVWASSEQRKERHDQVQPLNEQKAALERQLRELSESVLKRGNDNLSDYAKTWVRPPVDRTGTEERFDPIVAKFVRLVCVSQDTRPEISTGFNIDEFEIWSDEPNAQNVALASAGGKAFGNARRIEDFPDAYGPQLAIDGQTGARFIATSNDLTIELAEPTTINRVVFSSAKGESQPDQRKFAFVADYRVEVSSDREHWTVVASGDDRKVTPHDGEGGAKHRNHRLSIAAITDAEIQQRKDWQSQLHAVNRQLAAIPPLPRAWLGRHDAQKAKGPFHVFLGGSPQKHGDVVTTSSLAVMSNGPSDSSVEQASFGYSLESDSSESDRRLAFANWVTNSENALTLRVLANRLWHYHFGTGIVATPSDFGYMGQRPSHPKLLDFLAAKLRENHWQIKPMHKLIMMSPAYRQSSSFNPEAASVDSDDRLLWRFPPRRLSAEAIRDTMLQISGVWQRGSILQADAAADDSQSAVPAGGPGFRLYHFMQDNVCTYVPLDKHGPETYRRAVYHQNARASVIDLMTEFDQPDCAFGTPRRAVTTTPLQALTMLNHQFTLDMSVAMAKRLESESDQIDKQVDSAYQIAFNRLPEGEEKDDCVDFVKRNGLSAFCRAMLNASELIYIK